MRTLRGRLTLGVTAVLAGVLLVAGTLVARDVDRTQREALDERLVRTAELSRATARAAVQQELPAPDDRLDAVLDATRTSLRLLLADAVLLETGTQPPGRPARALGLRTSALGPAGARFRTFTSTLRDPGLGGLAVLQVTTPLGALERRQAALERRLAGLGLLALLVAGAGTWLAAELVLRPLRRLRATASSVAGDEDLDRRVPERDGPAELRSLAASVNAMLGRLGRSRADRERALEATRRFAADAGHELRTPLTSVLAGLSTLRRHPELDAARRAALLDDALAEHRRLVGLLDGLQALARGDAAPPATGDVDLGEVAAAAAGAAAARHPDLVVSAAVPDEPVVVRGWEPGLRLVAENLLENAARHGRPGGRALVRVEAAVDGVGPALSVEDDGPGVPEAERERVLAPFARVPVLDGDEERPGSGLGLALVAQQARHHGGSVEVGESAALGGARVTVRLGRDAQPG